jgi:hypothetical protein
MLILLVLFPAGCAGFIERSEYPDVRARTLPEIAPDRQIILLEKSHIGDATALKALAGRDGSVHLFAADRKRNLHHVELSGNEVIKREVIGAASGASGSRYPNALDAVEHPAGTIRVLYGDMQFARAGQDGKWRETRGNLCSRFIPAGEDLLCAFIADGKEIAAPKRTDWTVGLFILIPVVYGSEVHADKLVIARETQEGWAVLAILDPESNLSAGNDFMAAGDGKSLHFLYRNYDQKRAFIFAVGMGGGGYSSMDLSSRELRYARVPLERLPAARSDVGGGGPGQSGDRRPWLKLEGIKVDVLPFMSGPDKEKTFQSIIIPINRRFALDPDSGDINAIIHSGAYNVAFDDGTLKAGPEDSAWLRIRLREGRWFPHFNIVTARDIPDAGRSWTIVDGLIRNGPDECDHVLVYRFELGFFSNTFDICYLRRTGDSWSAPLVLGGDTGNSFASDLAFDGSGRVFAVWKSKGGIVAGRWLLPRK